MSTGEKKKSLIKFLVFAVLVGGFSLFLLDQDFSSRVITSIRGHALAPVFFILTYTAAGVLLIPSTILKIAGGSLFGLWYGLVFSLLGSTLGTILGYFIARFAGSNFVRDVIVRGRYQPLQNSLQKRGEFLVFILRIVPGVPFNVLNTASGLLNLRFWPYFFASFFGSLPSIAVLVYFSSALTESLLFRRSTLYLIFSLAALVLFLVLTRILRRYTSLPDSIENPET